MFAAARDCFAGLYTQVAEPSAIEPPGPLGQHQKRHADIVLATDSVRAAQRDEPSGSA
jgi:hypothetical protein